MGARDFRLENTSMASGRIGVAVVLVPLVWIMAALLILSEEPGQAVGFGIFLVIVGLLLAWMATRVPLSLAVEGERLVVRYPLSTRTFAVGEIDRVETGTMRSTIGPGTRRYPSVRIVFADGRTVRFLGDAHAAELLRSRTRPATGRSIEGASGG
jgi:hypothetical protein